MKFRRFLAFVLTFILLLQTLPVLADVSIVASGKCGDNLTWKLDNDGTLTISGSGKMYDWYSSKDVPWDSKSPYIKNVVLEDGVTSIARYAFSGCINLESIIIPESVTTIGATAFSDCSSLESITIPQSVTSIGEYAFYYSTSLESITIPESVIRIGSFAFSHCSNLTSVTIPESVTYIGESTFDNCTSLLSVIILEGVTKIDRAAFYGCTSLTSITIPESVTSIGEYAFNGCTSLSTVYYAGSQSQWQKIRIGASNDPLLNAKIMVACASAFTASATDEKVFYVEAGATGGDGSEDEPFGTIEEAIFALEGKDGTIYVVDSYNMTKFKLQEGWEGMVTIKGADEDAVIVVDKSMGLKFFGDITFKDIKFEIGAHAHFNPIGTKLIMDGGEDSNFGYMMHLTSYENHVVEEAYAEVNSGAIATLYMGGGYSTSYANGCMGDSTLVVNGGTIKQICFAGNHYKEDQTGISVGGNLSVVINGGEINSMTNKENTPPEVMGALNVIFNNGMQAPSKFVYPEETIAGGVFIIKSAEGGKVMPTAEVGVFEITADKGKVAVINGEQVFNGTVTLEAGETEVTWVEGKQAEKFFDKQESLSGKCGENLTWTLDSEGTLTISGSGKMYDWGYYEDIPWYSKRKDIKNVVLEDGVTSIGERAFISCGIFTSITIPDSVTSIGYLAFDDCLSLKSITIPDSVTSIGDLAFSFCKSLTSITIPESVTSIGEYAFYYCTSLESITIPESVTRIYDSTFQNCSSLESITIPQSVTSIGKCAFMDCSSLESITIPESVTSIGDQAFNGCTSLKSITIPESVTSIDNHAFAGCASLESITIPESVTSIGMWAFEGCTNLSTVYYAGSESQWQKIGIGAYNDPLLNANIIFEVKDADCSLGHDYAKEWTVDIQPTCTEKGSTSRHCSRCSSTTDPVSIAPKGHTYGEWDVVKVPDFANDGLKSRKCTACGHVQSETITKSEYDMEVNKGHGAAYFTVVNAVTKEPVSGVSIACSGTTVKTDSQGKAYAVLPVGKQQLTVYAKDYNTRNLNYTILNGENIIPVIGISAKPFIDVTFDHKEMTIDEIKNAGIDTTAQANQHVWNYQLTFRFDHVKYPQNYQFNIYWNKDHIPVKIDPVYPGGGPTVVWPGTPGYPDIKPGTPPFIVIPPCDSDDAPTTIYPIREGYYLVVKGSVKWLKEMFDVYMIILNTSQTDTVEDCTATLSLPDGISLAEMTADVGQQSLVQNVDYIGMGETETVHWYIKGDKKGKYNLSATLDGKYMPFEEQFHYEYTTPNPLIVEAGSAMHMTIEAPGVAYLGKPYPVRLTIENVSDMPVYGMNHTITSVDQFKIVANANGTFTKTDYDTEGSGTITHDVFNPGEKIVIELTTDVLFNTDLVYKQLSQIKDGAQSVKTFKNMYDALFAAHTAAKDMARAFDYMLYNTDESWYPGVFERFKQVHERLYNNCRILDARSAYIASEIRASEHYYVLDKFRTSNGQELPTMAELDACVSFVNKVIDDSQNLTYSEMRAFDKVKTVVTSIPLKFILKNVWVTTLEGSTTEIPCSFRIYNDNSIPGYFATEPVGKFVYDDFMDNFGELDMPNLYSNFDGLIPGTNRTHGGIIYAKPSDMIVVAAKSSGGKTNFRAWIEDQNGNVIPADTSLSLPDAQMMRTAATASLGCTNESSVLDNNVLSFTGPGYIKVQPADIENAVLVVEMSENGQTVCDKYTIQTVEDHVCSGNSWETVFPSVENDGYNARFCSTCETLLEVNTHGALNFSDVPKDSWYYNAVRYASINSLMNGTSDTTFSPEQGLTRAMFVTVLYRLAGSPTDGKHSFADVPDDAWYSNAVSWASANGIINGVSATEFAPDNNITREQMTAVVYRYSRYKNYGDETQADTAYSDKDNISDYAVTSVKWCSANGIIKGNADGTFNPGAYSTRAQAATVFMRLLTTFD